MTQLDTTPPAPHASFQPGFLGPFRARRLPYVILLLVLAIVPGELGLLTRELMLDAYFQVSVFVAMTLMLFYGSERLFKFNIGKSLQNAKMAQVPMAALLGSTPGCGGAVVVVAAYSSGHVGFGAVVATLTATMGDAAFLLIATRPDAAMVVLPLSFAVGIASGWIVDAVGMVPPAPKSGACAMPVRIGSLRKRDIAFLAAVLPGFVFGVLQLLQSPLYDQAPALLLSVIGLAGTFLGLLIWSLSPLEAMTNSDDTPTTRMAEETSFIAVWVIGAYLAYDYLVVFTGLELQDAFQTIAPLLPLIGILVGFIPGCGPQVLVATLFINGALPFAALIGNAISNDGDALFPAIALSPRTAVLATVVSAVPAFIVAYGFYFLAPGFMNP
ncbi:MAG: putative manganese transporter [Thalassovita sp.]